MNAQADLNIGRVHKSEGMLSDVAAHLMTIYPECMLFISYTCNIASLEINCCYGKCPKILNTLFHTIFA